MINRTVCGSSISCHHCGLLQDEYIEYFDGNGWCCFCAYINGHIEKEDFWDDQAQNKELSNYYNKLKNKQ